MKRNKCMLVAGILLCSFFVSLSLSAQESDKKWEYKFFAAYNLGGTSPVPFPREIRKVNSWSPEFGGTMAFQVSRWLTPQWGITAGLGVDLKSMKIGADVLYWQTNLEVGEGDRTGFFSGTFSGEITTKTRNGYIVLPVMAAYRPFESWTFRLGGYVASLQEAGFEGTAANGYIRSGGPTGDRIDVNHASYDFSDKMRKTDAGIMASADWNFTSKMAVTGQLSWGLVPIFPSDFQGITYGMYNIYFALGIAYRL